MFQIMMMDRPMSNIVIYKYINKGLIQFYLNILLDIWKYIGARPIGNNTLIRSGNQSSSVRERDDIKYFSTYHYFTIAKLIKFFQFVLSKLTTKSIVNITQCTGNVKSMFTLFNYFKNILESYNEIVQNKVTIYARINDWVDIKEKLFETNENDARKMKISIDVCKQIGNNSELYKNMKDNNNISFTEVFDTDKFPDNMTISKYMTLETQLTQNKGNMIMTYGYSGTGKTFTLFGNKENKNGIIAYKEGILQSTLNNIRGLEKVKIRVYEIYGKGVAYSHYWSSSPDSKIYQKLIYHKLMIKGENIGIDSPDTENSHTDMMKYVNDQQTYFDITGSSNITNIFNKFSNFVDEMDKIRKKKGRIRITPNNPESSRSIIIYDLLLLVTNEGKSSYVPFVIVDLPGREEIVQTYVDRFLEKDHVKIMFDDTKIQFAKSLLSCIAINPLEIAILTPSVIFETFNRLDSKERQNIMDNYIYDDMKKIKVQFKNHAFSINSKTKEFNELTKIYDFTNFENNYKFKMNQSKIEIITSDTHNNAINHKDQIRSEINSIQYQGIIAIFLLNRLILMNRFDILEKISQNIIEKYFNTQNFLNTLDTNEKKRNFMLNYLENNKVDNILKDVDETNYYLENLVKYNCFEAPSEGIYINENIVGLIKFLSHNILEKQDSFTSIIAPKQDEKLDFTYIKNNIRTNNFKLYKTEETKDVSDKYVNYENVLRSDTVLNNIYENNKNNYSSQKIFMYDKPIIENILSYYLEESKTENINILPVIKFKIFYLFSNTYMENKCGHQLKLLSNTLSLIKAVEN